jgi:hypothetical protein
LRGDDRASGSLEQRPKVGHCAGRWFRYAFADGTVVVDFHQSARTIFERVRQALTGMGFRAAEAQRMVEQVEERHRQAADSPSIEQVLREALLHAPSG